MSEKFQSTGTSEYSQFIHLSRYSRWLEKEGRRETWEETVDRYINFFVARSPELKKEIEDLKPYILDFKVMPSMRCLMSAGKALEKDEVAGYNCAYLTIDHPRAFDEIMYILMCGTGTGFSVERQYVNKLPDVAEEFYETDTLIIVPDSKVGWAKSFRELLSLLWVGHIPKWDLSKLRGAGARLKTFGGRSSGPEPLNQLFYYCVNLFKKAKGRKLTSLECHDLVCKIADVVVCGGVRRSATLSLSNLSDDRMREAKTGQWWIDAPHRALANNSVAYTEKPDFQIFLKEWKSLFDSKCGERGIFSRISAQKQASKARRDKDTDYGCNPCSEILLRSSQFCNLSEVIIRHDDSINDLLDKIKVATILGTLQSTLTNFRYIRNIWKQNTEEERLLGVSLTGIMDHPILGDCENKDLSNILLLLKEHSIKINKEWSAKLKINQSTAITCVKPSGTVSQLVNCASGIHSRFSKYYIRTVRCDSKDPMTQFMMDKGFPWEIDITNPNNIVFSFPMMSPNGGRYAGEVSAMEQLKLWKIYQDYWCEHKPSCTVYYKEDEFLEIGSWVWKYFDEISGISFLPYSDHIYKQAPYQQINKEKYEELLKTIPPTSWEELKEYEKEDNTKGAQTMACNGNYCEIVDII